MLRDRKSRSKYTLVGAFSFQHINKGNKTMTTVYLGYPPENVKNWILEHSAPAAKRETVFYFADGTSEEKLIEGDLGRS